MSRGPTKEGVSKLRELIRRKEYLVNEILEVREKQKKLEQLEYDHRMTASEILKTLEEMDCSCDDGNTGWQSRIIEFLTELERQATSC